MQARYSKFWTTMASLLFGVSASLSAQTTGSEETQEILAFAYPQDETISIELQGTARLPDANGEAEVERESGATQIEIELDDMKPAHLFGGDYTTYVLWAASFDGRPQNLGELILRGDRIEGNLTTTLDAFGLFVTAEPHFLVSSPSPFAVVENVAVADEIERVRFTRVSYDVVPGTYQFEHDSLAALPEASGEIHPHLEEARTAISLAEKAGAAALASEELQQARDAFRSAQAHAADDADDEELIDLAHQAVRLAVEAQSAAEARAAETAIVRAIESKERRIQELEAEAEAAVDEATRARLEAERERLRAETEAERAAEAERQAERRTRDRVQTLEEEAEHARVEAEQARREAERARAEAEQAQRASEEAHRRLRAALAEVIEVRETARGLILNVPNVLFDVDQASLRPQGRETLAKVAGILQLARGYRLSVEGHTDDTGSADYNLDLSRRRAESVRDYLVMQGVPPEIVTLQRFGESQPIASNETLEGRQRNRRVEIVIEELPEFTILASPSEEHRF